MQIFGCLSYTPITMLSIFQAVSTAFRTISAAVVFVKSHMETWLKKGLFIYSPDPLNHDDMRKTI